MNKVVFGIALIATALLAGAFSYLTITYFNDVNRLAALGQTIGAAFAAAGFIWILVAQYTIMLNLKAQVEELVTQKEELGLQRQVLEQSERTAAAHIYLQALNESKQTLGRYARSIVACLDQTKLDSLDLLFGQTNDPAIYVRCLTDDPALDSALSSKNSEVMISTLTERYRVHYERLRLLASRSAGGIELFELTFENSAYQQALARL